MTEKPQVKTIDQAFKASLGKWKRVELFARDLVNEFDTSCGFCDYTRSLSETGNRKDCEICPVKERCDKILSTVSEIEEMIDALIGSTFSFLEMEKLDQGEN